MKKIFLLAVVLLVSLVMAGCQKTNGPAPSADDKTPPIIISASPDDGPTDVSTKASVILTFSKKMDTASVKDAFSMSPSVNGAFKWSDGDTVMTFTPDSELAAGTLYSCLITPTAKDTAKNALENQVEWSWTTVAANPPSQMPVTSKLPPPMQFAAPPDLVVVPDTDVYVVPDSQEDIYFEQGWWWRNWNGHWYRSRYYDHEWGYYSGYPSWQGRIPHDWRNNYRHHMWGGHPWNPPQIHHADLDRHWRGDHWRDNNGWQGPQGHQQGFQGHNQQGQQDHAQQGFQGHNQQGQQGHAQQGFQGHNQQGQQGHNQQGQQGHVQQGQQGHVQQGQQGHNQQGQQSNVQQGQQGHNQQGQQGHVQQGQQSHNQQGQQSHNQQGQQSHNQQGQQSNVQQGQQGHNQQGQQGHNQQGQQGHNQQGQQGHNQQGQQGHVQQGQKAGHGVQRCDANGKPAGCQK